MSLAQSVCLFFTLITVFGAGITLAKTKDDEFGRLNSTLQFGGYLILITIGLIGAFK